MRLCRLAFAVAALLLVAGCHSAFINATISNHTGTPLSLVEVDYPSASFGTQTLAPGQDFHYRFKILGNGPTTLLWTDPQHIDHKNSGPALREGEDGALAITFIQGSNPLWDLQVSNH